MIQFRTECLSAHLDSFCRKLDELCGLEFVYSNSDPGATRRRIGWRLDATYRNGPITPENTERAKSVELLYDMLRELDLFEARAKRGLKTVYASERWFKPIRIGGGKRWRWTAVLPGFLRLLVPGYRRMARRFVRMMDDPNFHVFAIGVPAVRDFVRMYRILHGDWRALFREPKVEIERKLGGTVEGFPRMKLWAYFVEAPDSSTPKRLNIQTSKPLHILWIGSFIDWKRVDTLIKAFKRVEKKRSAALLLVGEGPERKRLEKLAGADRVEHLRTVAASATGAETANASRRGGDGTVEEGVIPRWQEGKIVFHDYVKNDVVRELMRRADVYVMPSDGKEGWGAAVSEALSEGCPVLSTFEAGSSATILPDEFLFHAGDARRLADLLVQPIKMVKYSAEDWGGEKAAERLMEIVERLKS